MSKPLLDLFSAGVDTERCCKTLGGAILSFFEQKPVYTHFSGNDLIDHVRKSRPRARDDSIMRVLRKLREDAKLNYENANRTKSLYIAVPIKRRLS